MHVKGYRCRLRNRRVSFGRDEHGRICIIFTRLRYPDEDIAETRMDMMPDLHPNIVETRYGLSEEAAVTLLDLMLRDPQLLSALTELRGIAQPRQA